MINISRTSLSEKVSTQKSRQTNNRISPFQETPSQSRQQINPATSTGASELFSLFTADIIKANSNFVR